MTMTLSVGDKAPDFTLPSSTGEGLTLSKLYAERTVVLYFYPKDHTPGCTVEACSFRDQYDDFVAAGAEVVGISSDSAASHTAFASKHKLPMKLAADEGGRVRALYGVRATLGILPGRVTFVIDRQGTIRHTFASQLRFSRHAADALEAVKRLQGGEGSESKGSDRAASI
jgi:thioredoxin-dependent peroxiredoxin